MEKQRFKELECGASASFKVGTVETGEIDSDFAPLGQAVQMAIPREVQVVLGVVLARIQKERTLDRVCLCPGRQRGGRAFENWKSVLDR